MKKLLVLLLCNCLLVSLASGQQGYVQRGDKLGDKIGDKFGDEIRKRNEPIPVTNQMVDPKVSPPSISNREASDKASKAYPGGTVRGIRRSGDQWKVRMDNGGTVFDVFVDAESGAVVRRPE